MSESRPLIAFEGRENDSERPSLWIEFTDDSQRAHYFVNGFEVTAELYRDVLATHQMMSLITLADAADCINWRAVGDLVDRALEDE